MNARVLVGVVVAAVAIAGGVVVLTRGATGGGAGPGDSASAALAAAPASGPAVSVTTVVVDQRNVDVMLDATGTVTSLNSVDVRPQVASVITKVHIKEGQFVRAGDALFSLDARNDEVNIAKAEAQLAKDQAALADADRQLARSQDLFKQNFISEGAVDTNQTLVDSQRAVVAADRAAITAAKVGMSYTRIVAPTSGRAGAPTIFSAGVARESQRRAR
ncbi:MAG TPA: efflux RND transporter periplasmic adaptor subunit [Caldimonas sp.]|jgi:multidrug efflux pump subunit AcrA (membrane-fusion protein)|nr:efflux RND transporter periplasmic adaptor subunit [Caldimonas sp.]HEX4232833.1 efflux RND transporter periplasmic adaptor subunit [Caldimonas sp.]